MRASLRSAPLLTAPITTYTLTADVKGTWQAQYQVSKLVMVQAEYDVESTVARTLVHGLVEEIEKLILEQLVMGERSRRGRLHTILQSARVTP